MTKTPTTNGDYEVHIRFLSTFHFIVKEDDLPSEERLAEWNPFWTFFVGKFTLKYLTAKYQKKKKKYNWLNNLAFQTLDFYISFRPTLTWEEFDLDSKPFFERFPLSTEQIRRVKHYAWFHFQKHANEGFYIQNIQRFWHASESYGLLLDFALEEQDYGTFWEQLKQKLPHSTVLQKHYILEAIEKLYPNLSSSQRLIVNELFQVTTSGQGLTTMDTFHSQLRYIFLLKFGLSH